MKAEDVRKWVDDHRAAAKRVAADARRNPLNAQEAYAAALELLKWDERVNGSPFERRDPITEEEDARMWEAWAKLRARWGRGG